MPTNSTLSAPQAAPTPAAVPLGRPRRSTALLTLAGLWIAIYFAALFAPPLLDDADATHANAARHMALSGDWVTLKVNGIRYLEKAALPYWLDAISFRIFGFNTFAAHLPEAIGVLLLALLGYHWSRRAYGDRAAFYTGLAVLTSAGVFLFTRIYIPEVLLSLFLSTALYCLLRSFDQESGINESGIRGSGIQESGILSEREARVEGSAVSSTRKLYAYTMWTALALAVLTKGLVALVFFFGAAIIYLALTGEWRKWRRLKPFTGLLLFLVIAAPWHILAGLRNTGGMNGHGFFWFYFINEHVLRFLGKRYPKDYNKLPGYLFWSLHLVWLFPWSLFAPIGFLQAWRLRKRRPLAASFPAKATLLFAIYAALVLVFFSLSTNQEYYTFPAYLALLALTAAALSRSESLYDEDPSSRRWITFAHATYTVVGIAAAIALGYGLWSSRHLPFVPDIGELLAHRGVGDYTLSMSHFFDLTGPSFAALRLPASLAALAFAVGPALAWWLRTKRRHLASTTAIALTSTVFLVAAHIALIRFGPMLSSANLAQKIQQLEDDRAVSPDTQVLLYSDQAYGSSIPFYLGRIVYLVDGRSTSMLFGSTFPDAPPIFLTHDDLVRGWGSGSRKILFVPLEKRDEVDSLLGNNKVLLAETSGKALFTDRPLDLPASSANAH
ncbi:ArnT family glycosyltransferase [Edaphobacter aggregans]|uniref:ArnT family glycosyltransferase n=1 Tax=Edaphobacter aggregans TaxID=570835 RepID=UPI000A00AB9B|nr:glycosyltransferase family 39 protein [Edaphobacter aggregans]